MNTFEILDLSSRREGARKSPQRQQLSSWSRDSQHPPASADLFVFGCCPLANSHRRAAMEVGGSVFVCEFVHVVVG